jgi:hypothetical protein
LETSFEAVGDFLQVQALAVLVLLQFAFDVGIQRLETEVSYNELLTLIQDSTPCFAHHGVLIEDIFTWKDIFHYLSFSFC